MEKFEQYFVRRRNVIYEHSKFNQSVQESDETVGLFIIALCRLVEICNYSELTDKMIHDRIVVGIRDNLVVERLQLDPELILEKVIQVTRQNEALKPQKATVRAQQQEQPITVVNVITSKQRLPPTRGNYRNNYRPPTIDKLDSQCGWCGRAFHPVNQCPAIDAICRKCQKKGHFQHMCGSKLVAAVSVESTDYEFLGTITSSHVDSAEAGGKPWMICLQMNNQLMEFKIDSGADVTVIAETDYLETWDGPLQMPSRILALHLLLSLVNLVASYKKGINLYMKIFLLSKTCTVHIRLSCY